MTTTGIMQSICARGGRHERPFFFDLNSPYIELKEELDAAYRPVMESGWYILGKEVEAFEDEFAIDRKSVV